MLFSVVVPCYNEGKNIRLLTELFKKVRTGTDELEIILVNNGSTDKSAELFEEVEKEDNRIRVVTVTQNKGYGYGILAGLKEARGDYLGWIHADLQFYPQEIGRAMRYIRNAGYSNRIFVKGIRKQRPVGDYAFTLGMSIYETFLLQKRLWDINAQPVMFHRSLYETWEKPPYDFSLDLYAYYTALVEKLEICRFPVAQHKRLKGNSSWNKGLRSRIKLIKRVLKYSKSLKKRVGK